MSTPGRKSSRRRHDDKQRYHHGNLYEALLDVACDLVAKEGHGTLALREVARHAKVTHSAVYHHFRSREALLAAVAERGFHDMIKVISTAKSGSGNAAERFKRHGRVYIEHGARNGNMYRLMFGSEVCSGSTAYPRVRAR